MRPADQPTWTTTNDAVLERATFTSFEESTAEEWAAIARELRVTEGRVADNLLDQLRLLAADHGGFAVHRLEHSLQTATRAARDGRDNEYVVCALLHDIGDNLAPRNHPDVAAAILKPFVSEANHWLVQHHGVFQGYYYWHFVDGDRFAKEAYRDSPYFDYTEEFCYRYDQCAFDPDYPSEPLEHFEPLIREFFAPKP